MELYYLLFVFSVIIGVIYYNNSLVFVTNNYSQFQSKIIKRKNIKYLCLVFLFCGLLIGLRSISVGIDTQVYVSDYYNGVKNNGIYRGSPEIVINILIWISQLFSNSYQLFFILYAVVVTFSFGYFIFKNSNNVVISVIVFLGMFYVQSMNLMREWLAVGFGLNAIAFLKNKHFCKALLLFALAFMSHLTAICLVLIVPAFWVKDKTKGIVFLIIICAIIFIFKTQIMRVAISFVPRYSGYSYQDVFINNNEFNIKDLIFVVIAAFYAYTIYRIKVDNQTKDTMYLFLYIQIIAITFSLCGGTFNIMHRLVYYFSAFLIVSLPYFISRYKEQKIIYFFLIIAMFIMLYRNQLSDNNGIANYIFCWKAGGFV